MSEFLNTANALELADNDADLYKELLQLYENETQFDAEYFSHLILTSKEDAAHYIHRIKGASAQIGAERLHDAGQEIEDILREKKDGNLPALIKNFSALYDGTKKEIAELLNC